MAIVPTIAIKGLVLGTLGTPERLSLAASQSEGDESYAPFTDAYRVGMYFDRTPGQERAGWVIGGQLGPTMVRSGSGVDMDVPGTLSIRGVPVTGGGYTAVNKDATAILNGQAVATDVSGVGVVLASATSPATPAVGLAVGDTAPLAALSIKTAGLVTLSDWALVTGTSLLIPRARYYLDPATPGRLTSTAPSLSGQIVQQVGMALSSNILGLFPSAYLLL